ncbi:sensor histidine kinase [Solimonas soli]|uniref:sensor histidine kinase n=1 Tax=Solimonas soli TaxID=413479 RepID=UPI0005BA48EB|nr:sensor histidine kinase [Solimonas soli]
MTIRSILLSAFLAVGLLPAVVLTALSFTRTQAAMRAEIEQSLSAQAAVAASDLDKQVFERLQNAVTWAHLEVMQDLHVGDVDKRLSNFLADMQQRYGAVYVELDAIDARQRIVASSRPQAIGGVYVPAPAWQTAELPGGTVTAEAPQRRGDREVLVLRVPIASQFTEGRLGELVLVVDWTQAAHELDAGAREQRAVAVVDRDGRIVAVSQNLRARLDAGVRQIGTDWLAPRGAPAAERDGAPLAEGRVIVSAVSAPGRGPFAGFGWTTLVLESSRAALAPVRQMALSFLGLLLLTAAATVVLAFAVSGRIARPVVALTDYVRGFMRKQHAAAPPPASGEVGELTRAFTQMVDDLDASRQTLVRASQLAAIGEFAAMMAHEIRTPLGILRSSAQMLERDAGISGESRELIGFIDGETQRLNRLVGDLLDRARVRAPQRLPENLDALVDRCLAMLSAQAARQGATLEHEPCADPVADVDAEQMTQVLLNLLLNALHVVPQGGGRVRVALRSEGDDVLLIEVADNGPGIAPAERQRVFEPFVYRREGGLGLGLAVVKQIVSAHGGDIAVDAAALGGARFRIRLPRRAAA